MDILAKVVVIYESKYGNTELVAENVIKDMRRVKGIQTVLT